jgi:nucleotide sugar dehydrogenase
MAVAVASARSKEGDILYQVTGVDQNTHRGHERVAALARGVFPFKTTDKLLGEALTRCHDQGNLVTTTDESAYASADVVVIDIPLDINLYNPVGDDESLLGMAGFETAFRQVSQRVRAGTLILVESTVPPGTCERFLLPILSEELKARHIEENAVHLAHSYERVMPGDHYLESITKFWRVYAGADATAADVCATFLSSIIEVDKFPLTRLASMTASETAKLMENTYRAANIAFVDEWTKYAEAVGIDLYEVIDAIRMRPTHSNIRFPGIGVGGYCLTKDPAFAPAAAQHFLDNLGLHFPFSHLALKVNQAMPLHCAQRLVGLLGDSCQGKKILLLGISYRQDVGDTRFSSVEILARALQEAGGQVHAFDPFVSYWPEMDWQLPDKMPGPDSFNAVVFATPHRQFIELDLLSWLDNARPVVLDTVNTVSKSQRDRCRSVGVRIESIGRGDGL